MEDKNIKQIYVECLISLLDAERQLVDALPMMANAATSPELKKGFIEHLEQTREHVARLERIFQNYELNMADVQPNLVMQQLIKEGEKKIAIQDGTAMTDARLIGAGQIVEHYEMGCYEEMIALAQMMERDEEVELLKETLKEEKETSQKLMEIGEKQIMQAVITA